MENKKYFTKEQLKKLEVAEYHFATAVNANYKRGTQRALNEMLADEYANCCLNNFKVIGRLYFESKKYYEEQEQEQQLTFDFEGANNDAVLTETEPAPENKPSTKTVAKNKKKAGRPKKNK